MSGVAIWKDYIYSIRDCQRLFTIVQHYSVLFNIVKDRIEQVEDCVKLFRKS
jgi:hypothetical protein